MGNAVWKMSLRKKGKDLPLKSSPSANVHMTVSMIMCRNMTVSMIMCRNMTVSMIMCRNMAVSMIMCRKMTKYDNV